MTNLIYLFWLEITLLSTWHTHTSSSNDGSFLSWGVCNKQIKYRIPSSSYLYIYKAFHLRSPIYMSWWTFILREKNKSNNGRERKGIILCVIPCQSPFHHSSTLCFIYLQIKSKEILCNDLKLHRFECVMAMVGKHMASMHVSNMFSSPIIFGIQSTLKNEPLSFLFMP